jgi:hypothetical protein
MIINSYIHLTAENKLEATAVDISTEMLEYSEKY